jgi:predicted nucleotidyltransferase
MNNKISDLPENKQKIIKALINKIKSEYRDDIAVVVCYGSYITDSAYQKSDLDFFFIPKANKGYEMNMQFIIDDIGYDFWPLSWDRAEQIANFKETITSIIAEGVVVYYNKPADLKRFNSLKERINELTTNPENKNILINEAEKLLTRAKSIYFEMEYISEEYALVDSNCAQILNLIANATALLNSKYIKKGVYNIEDEIKNYSILPENYLKHFNLAVRSSSLKSKKEFIKKIQEFSSSYPIQL